VTRPTTLHTCRLPGTVLFGVRRVTNRWHVIDGADQRRACMVRPAAISVALVISAVKTARTSLSHSAFLSPCRRPTVVIGDQCIIRINCRSTEVVGGCRRIYGPPATPDSLTLTHVDDSPSHSTLDHAPDATLVHAIASITHPWDLYCQLTVNVRIKMKIL